MATPINHGPNNDRNVIVQLEYDKGGRTTSLRDPRGNLTTYGYDALDRRTTLTNPLSQTWTTSYEDLPDGGSRTRLSHPNGYDVTREFDLLGRLNAINYGEATSTPDVRFFYDAAGNRTRMTEYGGAGYTDPVRETTYSYDRVRRLAAVAFDSDGDSSAEQTVEYAYDAGGRRTRLTLPGDLDVTYQYDAKGQLIGLSDWDAQATEYAYDSAGRLIAAERDNGLRSRYVYDAAGRLRILRHSAGERLLGHFAYEVDQRGNRTQALEALPHPATTDDTVISYDDPGLVARGTWTSGGESTETTQFAATLRLLFLGNEATLTMGEGPDHSLYDVYIGHSLWQSFDGYAATAGERQIEITLDGEGPHVLEIRNRADRNLQSSGYVARFKQLVVPNRTYDAHTIAYEYDTLSRLLDARYNPGLNVGAADGNLLRRYQYGYDLAGNRLAEIVTVGGTPVTTNYSYNAVNQLVSDSTHTLTYDNNGNLTSDGTHTYTWDRANRLTSMGGVSYQYDGLGHRVQQSNGIDATQYLLDVQPGLAVVLNATTGGDTTRYVHGPRGIHAQQDNAGAWDWPVQDGLGSVRGVADNTLALLESRQYAPYGEPYDVVGVPQTTYGFTGEPTDANDLVYLRARYLNPALGVFASRDPWEGMAQRAMSLNGYSWVEGNVPNAIDPSGNYWFLNTSDPGKRMPQPDMSDVSPGANYYISKLIQLQALYSPITHAEYPLGPDIFIDLLTSNWDTNEIKYWEIKPNNSNGLSNGKLTIARIPTALQLDAGKLNSANKPALGLSIGGPLAQFEYDWNDYDWQPGLDFGRIVLGQVTGDNRYWFAQQATDPATGAQIPGVIVYWEERRNEEPDDIPWYLYLARNERRRSLPRSEDIGLSTRTPRNIIPFPTGSDDSSERPAAAASSCPVPSREFPWNRPPLCIPNTDICIDLSLGLFL